MDTAVALVDAYLRVNGYFRRRCSTGERSMQLWHLTPDTTRIPSRISAGDVVHLHIGTWPIEPRQHVWVEFEIQSSSGAAQTGRVDATWRANRGVNSKLSVWAREHAGVLGKRYANELRRRTNRRVDANAQ